ncbi:BamA/TamA family outer membrane protein [Pseudohaliea rubra]|uniref:Bacterial surface antigen (D15) domain-containing protein n=1 Tax=Pseudohaliea rubra DSM 19751 TaxID=1265313 RepID=A0A095VMR1_9GAMM|nr:hypothetical protein [Pseudohaliea rubra]KGE02650.1 hypothetical protein HRUBRA_02788 [Pseudohaliea rubra DSM 19751]
MLPWAEEAAAGQLEAIPAGIGGELAEGGVVGRLITQREQVFDLSDPKQDNALFRAANGLHVLTRDQTIREQLPFLLEGEDFVPLELVEAERVLRSVDWLYDARVVPVRRCGEAVDLAVVTRDVWTILPTVSFDRSGGESSWSLGVEDENLLGRGETLGVFFTEDVDRSGYGAYFFDPAVAGTPWRLNLSAADNDDGHRLDMHLRHPFRSLDERSSVGLRLTVDERIQPLFDAGDRVVEFQQQFHSGELQFAESTGRENGHVRRWNAGVAWWDYAFDRAPGPLQPPELPEDRSAAYPFVGFETIEDDFVPIANLALIGRPQDVHLGRRLAGRIGFSPDGLGADDGRVIFEGSWRDAIRPRESLILSGALSVNGAVTTSDGEAENLFATIGTELHYLQTDSWRFYAALDATWTEGLTDDIQLQLGGDLGLRGYPQRFQQGDRRLRLRAEERWYASGEPLRLFRWGAAFFLDAGRAWFPDDPNDNENGWLANAGIGLRLMPTRLPTSGMIHIDLAAPLRTGGRDVDKLQLSVTVRSTF